MANVVSLSTMLKKFGVVTTMDIVAYKYKENSEGNWDSVSTLAAEPLFSLNTLKITNINAEGPDKEIKGGQNADTLLKYGKTFTFEATDALGTYEVLKHIYGSNEGGITFVKNTDSNGEVSNSIIDGHYDEADKAKVVNILTFTDRFSSEITLVCKTFVLDQATGNKQPINVVIPRLLPDSILNLTMDAEGDASTFDLNGNLLCFDKGNSSLASIDSEGYIYGAGVDNSFYFYATDLAVTALAYNSFSEVMSGNLTKVEDTTDTETESNPEEDLS